VIQVVGLGLARIWFIYTYLNRYTLHIRCYGRELTKYAVKYGVYIRIYTVLADPTYTVLWQGNHQIYGQVRCVYIQFWPTPHIQYFWQGNHQIYGQVRCVYIQFWPTLHIRCYGRVITRYTVKYGVYIYSFGRPYIYGVMAG